jgi:uncharacterized membrane protein
MDQKPRGEPVGCVALLVGLAALALAASTSAPGRWLLGPLAPGPAGPAPAAAGSTTGGGVEAPGSPAATAAIEALREETRRARGERMATRKERMLVVAADYGEGERRQYHRIRLRNTCRYPVAVALHYRDIDDSPVTRGWWEVAPGDSVTADAMTRDTAFYLYAENQAAGRKWDGEGRADALALVISDEKFDQLEGEPTLFRAPRTVSFAKRETGPQWTDALETFECPVEEAPPKGTVAKPPSAGQGPRNP